MSSSDHSVSATDPPSKSPPPPLQPIHPVDLIDFLCSKYSQSCQRSPIKPNELEQSNQSESKRFENETSVNPFLPSDPQPLWNSFNHQFATYNECNLNPYVSSTNNRSPEATFFAIPTANSASTRRVKCIEFVPPNYNESNPYQSMLLENMNDPIPYHVSSVSATQQSSSALAEDFVAKLNTKEEEATDLEAAETQKESEMLKSKVSELEEENARLKEDKNRIATQKQEIQMDLHALEVSKYCVIHDLRKDVSSFRDTNKNLAAAFARITAELDATRKEKETLSIRVNQLERQSMIKQEITNEIQDLFSIPHELEENTKKSQRVQQECIVLKKRIASVKNGCEMMRELFAVSFEQQTKVFSQTRVLLISIGKKHENEQRETVKAAHRVLLESENKIEQLTKLQEKIVNKKHQKKDIVCPRILESLAKLVRSHQSTTSTANW